MNYRKGALLELNNIFLSEGTWDPKAYEDALARAWERTYSMPHPRAHKMDTKPAPFTNPADPGTSTFGFDPNAPAAGPTELYEEDVNQPGNEPQAAPGVDVPDVPRDADPLPDPNAVQSPDQQPEGPVAEQPGKTKA